MILRSYLPLAFLALVSACGVSPDTPDKVGATATETSDLVDLPEHSVDITPLEPRRGARVEIKVSSDISREQCEHLIKRYRQSGAPDGQVSVHKPSEILEGAVVPWCVENFDGAGIRWNDNMF